MRFPHLCYIVPLFWAHLPWDPRLVSGLMSCSAHPWRSGLEIRFDPTQVIFKCPAVAHKLEITSYSLARLGLTPLDGAISQTERYV